MIEGNQMPNQLSDVLTEGLMKTEQVAEFLAVSKGSVYGLIRQGQLPVVRLAANNLRVPRQAVIDFARGKLTPAKG